MNLIQIKGNTWAIEANQLIPLYRLDGGRCILLDTGLLQERDGLIETLETNALTPVGVLCSHAHVDHCANNAYLRERYGAKIALTYAEAGMCASLLSLKCYYLTLSPDTVERESACMVHVPDVIIPPEDGPFSFCGVEFQIIQTPGHSAGHICTITPDRVCYAADALLSREQMQAKLPYNLSIQAAMDSREKLRGLDCDWFLMAHKGVCAGGEIGGLIEDNQALSRRRTEEILNLAKEPVTASQLDEAVCTMYALLTQKPRRALRFERNIRFFIEFLTDSGQLLTECKNGTVYYKKAE